AKLEDGTPAPLRYGSLPGGIVLGLRAHPGAALAADAVAGARLRRAADGRLELGLADGRALRLPAVDPAMLSACLEFVTRGAGSNSLVDLVDGRRRFAPAFAGTALENLLVQQDGVPHRLRPATTLWKSLLLDRDVRIDASGSDLALSADL